MKIIRKIKKKKFIIMEILFMIYLFLWFMIFVVLEKMIDYCFEFLIKSFRILYYL